MNEELIRKASHSISSAIVSAFHMERTIEIEEAIIALASAFRPEPSQPTTQQSKPAGEPLPVQGNDILVMFREAYLAGFDQSGEGYNAEYPFSDQKRDPEKDARWIENRETDLTAILLRSKGQL